MSLVPVTTIINEVITTYKKQISDKKIAIDFHKGATLENLVPHYYTHLILDNIIGNAIKYTSESSTIYIELTLFNSNIICTVRDEGIGIKKEDLDNLFNRFFRSDALNHKNISGNGLGLSIAKKAADAIQAKITINSELCVGTTFVIKF